MVLELEVDKGSGSAAIGQNQKKHRGIGRNFITVGAFVSFRLFPPPPKQVIKNHATAENQATEDGLGRKAVRPEGQPLQKKPSLVEVAQLKKQPKG